jgi:hypothetical protein
MFYECAIQSGCLSFAYNHGSSLYKAVCSINISKLKGALRPPESKKFL